MNIDQNRIDAFLLAVGCSLVIGCAPAVPRELVSARETYQIVNSGWTAYAAPLEMQIAKAALELAERAFRIDPNSYQVRDLAYVAERKSLFAEATAIVAAERALSDTANAAYPMAQVRRLPNTGRDFRMSQNAQEIVENRFQVSEERKFEDAQGEILGNRGPTQVESSVSMDEEKGDTLISLSVGLLFESGAATLTVGSIPLLDRIADILLGRGINSLRVEAHGDSSGASVEDAALSQRRADTVREYLIQRGYDKGGIAAVQCGDGAPIGDNENTPLRDAGHHIRLVLSQDPDIETSDNSCK